MPTPANMKAFVYCCFDPKVWPKVVEIFYECFGRGNYFLGTDPGAVKNLVSSGDLYTPKIVIAKIKSAYALHPFETIILVNHSNCGAYRLAGKSFDNPESEEEFHKKELDKAVKLLKKHFPKLNLEIHYFLKEEGRMKW